MCNESDQDRVRQLIYYESGENEEMIAQNMELALELVRTSRFREMLPREIFDMTPRQLMN